MSSMSVALRARGEASSARPLFSAGLGIGDKGFPIRCMGVGEGFLGVVLDCDSHLVNW